MICCSARRPKRQLFVQKDHVTGANFLTATDGEPFNPSPNAVLILTLRMGFGHLRIAHAVASWLDGCEAYVYDLLATDTPESESLKRYEWIYSKFSKVASASGGPIEWAFDKFLTSGDASAQCVPAHPPPARPAPTRRACPASLTLSAALGRNKLRDVALRLKPLTDGIPLDITVVATHAVAGHIAVEAGFRKVINLVVDNYAQHFNAVPGAINAVQAGALGAAYAKLGYQTVLAGHWADRRSVEGIHTDTARRMKRIHNKAVRRLVISIGGAGAQATFVIELLAALQPGMAAKTWHVVLNCGDAKETQAAPRGSRRARSRAARRVAPLFLNATANDRRPTADPPSPRRPTPALRRATQSGGPLSRFVITTEHGSCPLACLVTRVWSHNFTHRTWHATKLRIAAMRSSTLYITAGSQKVSQSSGSRARCGGLL